MKTCNNLAQYIVDFAERKPDSDAIFDDQGVSLSYQKLKDKVASLGELLREKNVRSLGILADRTISAYVGVLGASWAAVPYVPFSLDAPEERLLQQYELAGCDALLVDKNGLSKLTSNFCKRVKFILVSGGEVEANLPSVSKEQEVFCLDNLQVGNVVSSPCSLTGEEIAYIIFTSGSTGIPKGVSISVAARDSLAQAYHEIYKFSESDRVAQPVDLAWDVSVGNMLFAWTYGASLHLLSKKDLFFPVQAIQGRQITVWHSAPIFSEMLYKRGNLSNVDLFPSLKYTVFAGAPLSRKVMEAWKKAAPNSLIYNSYGPTEATVECSTFLIPFPIIEEGIAIGKPFSNCRFRVLSEERSDVPEGEIGELYISGAQLANGYIKSAEQTLSSFCVLKNGKNEERYYRTGDLVQKDQEGVYHYVGRVDNQVKILGHRLELGEVETAIKNALGALNIVVTKVVDDIYGEQLIAFIEGEEDNFSMGGKELQLHLKRVLPSYMVPFQVYFRKKFPRLSNGKLDRKKITILAE